MASFRGTLRLAAIAALLEADTIAGANIFPEYDWATSGLTEPTISVTTRRWRNEDRTDGIGVPQFWSTIWLGAECRVAMTDQSGTGRGELIAQLDELSDQVENAMAGFIIGPPQLFRRLTATEGEMRVSAEGTSHQGAIDLGFGFEYANDGEAQLTNDLQKLVLTMIRRSRFGDRFGRSYLRTIAQFVIDDFDQI